MYTIDGGKSARVKSTGQGSRIRIAYAGLFYFWKDTCTHANIAYVNKNRIRYNYNTVV